MLSFKMFILLNPSNLIYVIYILIIFNKSIFILFELTKIYFTEICMTQLLIYVY